jgi:hypothetical protein
MQLAPGTILREKYQIVRKVDGGEVFEARHLELAGRYAIKLLCEGGIRNALLLDELRREALATSALTHPGILRVYDLDQAPDGSPFIVMEYLSGQELGRVVAETGPLALRDVAAIVEAIASPLAEAHRQGIVHGDLTPENVFLLDADTDRHARVKLLDFGVARIRARAGGIVRGAGAHRPLAPEQQRNRDWEIDERTDVFALGALAYTLISGRGPTARATTPGRAVAAEDAPPLATTPAVAAVVARAMNMYRDGRFRSVTNFAQALREAVAASPARASGVRSRLRVTPPIPVATLHPPTARVRLATRWQSTVAIAGAFILAIAIIGATLLTKRPRAPAPLPKVMKAPALAAVQPPPKPTPAGLAAAPPAPAPTAPVPTAALATASARQTLPVVATTEVVPHHHHRSPHAGMTDADRHEMAESYKKATRAFDIGNYDEAIAAYKQTYELGGDAPMLYNIAQALRLSKRPDEAVVYYRRYLDREPAAANRDEVRTKIAELGGAGLVKASAVTTEAAAPRAPFDCDWPAHAAVGKTIDVSCVDLDPATPVAKVFLLYRVTGTAAFTSAELARGLHGFFVASIPAAAVSPKGLELYFEARRASGEAIAKRGSASRPNAIVVSPP